MGYPAAMRPRAKARARAWDIPLEGEQKSARNSLSGKASRGDCVAGLPRTEDALGEGGNEGDLEQEPQHCLARRDGCL